MNDDRVDNNLWGGGIYEPTVIPINTEGKEEL